LIFVPNTSWKSMKHEEATGEIATGMDWQAKNKEKAV